MRDILLVIDPQNAYFEESSGLKVVDGLETLGQIKQLMTGWDGDVYLVRHFQAETPFAEGLSSSEIHPVLRDSKFDALITKKFPSAFSDTGLEAMLGGKSRSDRRIFVCGYQTHHCCLATVYDAARFSDQVFIIADACSSPAVGQMNGFEVHEAGLAFACQFVAKQVFTSDLVDVV
jgi:nicotinamidase-related amidase